MKRMITLRSAFGLAMSIVLTGCSMYTFMAYPRPERTEREIGILHITDRGASEGHLSIIDIDGKIPDEDRPDWPWEEIHFLPGTHTLRVHFSRIVRSYPTETRWWSKEPKTVSFIFKAGSSYSLDFEFSYDDWRPYIKLLYFLPPW